MLDGKTSISNCPVGTITIAATQAQVHIVLPDSCTYAFGTADSYYSTSSDVGGKYGDGILTTTWVQALFSSKLKMPQWA